MSDSQVAASAVNSAPAPDAAPVDGVEPSINQQGEALEKVAEEIKEQKQQENFRKKYNLKVNGKSKDIELDLSNDAEVQKYLQKAMASDEKFQEAAMTRKQMEYLINELKTNPLAVLSHPELGLNVKELAQKVMEQELEDIQKSPEQKKIEELEKKLKDKEEREKTLEEEKRAQQMAKMEAEAAQQLDDQITEAISKSDLPKSPYVIKRLTDAMIEAVNMGYTSVTPEQIMPYVEEMITDEIQKLFEASPDEVLEKLVNKKRLDGYRKARVSQAKAKAPAETLKNAVKDTGSKVPDKKSEQPPIRTKDFFKF